MSLKIKNLKLTNFRNYPSLQLSNFESLVVLEGPNAIGKTNILEAIQLITSLYSFKNSPASQLVFWGHENARVSTDIADSRRSLKVDMNIEEGRKKYYLNGKLKKTKELKSLIPAVLFSPDDLMLIKGSQSGKRSSFDAVGVQMSSNYGQVKKDYEKVITHKNKLLKENYKYSLFESINETLLRVGTQLYCYRSSLFARMIPLIKSHYENISNRNEDLSATYTPSWEIYNSDNDKYYLYSKEEAYHAFEKSLKQHEEEEIARKRSLVGPHADKIDFFISQKNAQYYASQGQQRSLVLSLKLAEVDLVEDILNQKPILLLDDVMSELDSSRRNLLMDYIEGDIQTFITTTHLDYFSDKLLDMTQVINLEKMR